MVALLAAAQDQSGGSPQSLEKTIPQVTAELRSSLAEPLLPVLEQAGLRTGGRLVFVPAGAMNFLPLHAIPLSETESWGDQYEIGYTPSLSVLLQCIRRRRPKPTRLVAVVDPTRGLTYPPLEAALARGFFSDDKSQLLKDVDYSGFFEHAATAHVFYWIGHAQFSVRVPYWSGLVFCNSGPDGPKLPDDLITYIDIDSALQMKDCSLAILSGCQSGLALPGKGNEWISLVAAFFNAGAKCVLASLWPVGDQACLLTMHRFLQAWREKGQPIAAALQTAQHWLRNLTVGEVEAWYEARRKVVEEIDETWKYRLDATVTNWEERKKKHGDDYRPFASPYYWAGFVAVGQSWEDPVRGARR